ncbi:hypothetical protein MUO14_14370 [Halobacillus shinanisalinarum]|uniref:YesK-like protein n=1 Tax=Halobacillus shinanisalinarum TaxID=2932258 RepID=A0ABY4H5X4_9BACI|nr:YesK family protein [Halobacillus shinanisalinarum]UOQ95704.1 hypothetical protein MUO14_14370 [Halobacillus shinanisalinarum]
MNLFTFIGAVITMFIIVLSVVARRKNSETKSKRFTAMVVKTSLAIFSLAIIIIITSVFMGGFGGMGLSLLGFSVITGTVVGTFVGGIIIATGHRR